MAGGGNMGAAQPGNASVGGGQGGYGGGSLFGQQPQYQQPQQPQQYQQYQQPQQYQQQYQQPQFQQPFGGPFAYGGGNGYQGGFPGYGGGYGGYGGGPQMGYGPMMGGYGGGYGGYGRGGYGPQMGRFGGYGGGQMGGMPPWMQRQFYGNQPQQNLNQPDLGAPAVPAPDNLGLIPEAANQNTLQQQSPQPVLGNYQSTLLRLYGTDDQGNPITDPNVWEKYQQQKAQQTPYTPISGRFDSATNTFYPGATSGPGVPQTMASGGITSLGN
jgi:hypothetical protein